MKYKALLFGSIGTIIETSEIQRRSFNDAFKELGIDWYWDEKDYRKLLKKSGGTKRIEDFAEKNNTNVDAKKIRERKTQIYNDRIDSTSIPPREGVLDVLEYALKNKIKIGFVTSTTLDNIDAVFKTLNNQIKKNHFDFIGNNTLIKEAKPAPDIYIEALNSLELNSSDCIAIEDTVESALSAHRAKIKCIAFPGLFHADDDFSFCLKKLDKLNTSIFN